MKRKEFSFGTFVAVEDVTFYLLFVLFAEHSLPPLLVMAASVRKEREDEERCDNIIKKTSDKSEFRKVP